MRIKDKFLNRLQESLESRRPLVEPEKVDNVFDYNSIIRLRPYWEKTIISNNLYGASYCLKRYSGYKKNIQCAIEHGMPHTFTNTYEYKDNDAKILLVCSEERKKQLVKYSQKEIETFGPFIAYAKPIYSDFAMSNIKENLGKTLVAFPVHSIEDYHFSNTTKEFISLIEKIKLEHSFDTVLVCAYFVDIQRGLHIPYLQRGFQIVSNGNRLNYDFMDIQRTIMEIADCVLCQGYSSALGYAGYFHKSIMLHDIDMIVQHDSKVYKEEHWMQYGKKMNELFSSYSETLSEEQYNYLNWLYGYDCVKTPNKLSDIFTRSEIIDK